MATSEQLARLARILASIRTGKEALPAINHGPNAVTAEQIAHASTLLDRMHRRATDLSAALGVDVQRAADVAPPPAVEKPTAAAGRRAA